MRKWLKGKKSYLVAIAGILASIIAYANGEIDTMQLIIAILGSAGLTSIRAAISKLGN